MSRYLSAVSVITMMMPRVTIQYRLVCREVVLGELGAELYITIL